MIKNYVWILLIGFFFILLENSMAQVTITPATGGTSLCVGATASTTLGAITIGETANGDIPNGAQSYTIVPPPNFEFDNTAALNYLGTSAQISGMTTPVYTATSIQFTFTVAATAGQLDQLVVNGIKVRAITSPGFGYITSSTNTLGVNNSVSHGLLFSIAPPSVSITNSTGGSTCTSLSNNTTFNAYGASTYQFFIDGSPAGTGSSLSYNWATTAGSPHNVHVVGTSNGCSAQSSTIVMVVNQTPSVTWAPSDQSYAVGDADNTLNFNGSINPVPAGGVISFSGNGVSLSGGNYKFSPSAAGNGTHPITLTYVRNGCTGTTSQPFVVSTANSISGLNSSYCNYHTGNTVTIVPPAGKTVSTYQYYNWNTTAYNNVPSYVSGNSCPFSPVDFQGYSGALSGITYGAVYLRVLYTDATYSPLSYTYVYDRPYVDLSVPSLTMCTNGADVTVSLYPTDNGLSYTQVTGTGVYESSPGTWRLDPSGPTGSRTITYYYKTTFSPQCENSQSINVTVNPPPTASITNVFDPVGYCTNSNSFALTGNPIGGNFSGPGTFANYFYPYYNTSIGSNTITYTYTDVNGCTDTDTRNINVFDPATVSITMQNGDTSVCLPLVGDGTYIFEGRRQGPATGVNWFGFDGVSYTNGGNGGTFNFASPTGTNNTATSYTNTAYQSGVGYGRIRAITTGQPASCPAGVSTVYAFLIPKPEVIITNLVKDRYCSAEPNINLSARANYKYPDYFNDPLALSNGIGDVTNIASIPPGDPALVGSVFQPSSATAGNHDIRFTFTDPTSGCTHYNDTTIIINENPIADFGVDSGRCATELTYFNADISYIPPSTTVDYTWDFGDGTTLADTSHIQKPSYRYPFPGGYPVSLTLLTNEGCSDTKLLSGANLLTIQRIPKSKFDFRFQCFGDVTTFDTLSTDIDMSSFKSRTWIFASNAGVPFDTIYQTVSSSPTNYSFIAPGNYIVTLVDSTTLGCTDRMTKPVFILPYITPTATNPYSISFKDSTGKWGVNGTNSTWVHDIPNPANKPLMYYGGAGVIDSAWVTADTTSQNIGFYKAGEKSHLNSPCINFSQLDKPMISIKLWTATQEQIAGAVLNASIDNGITWTTVGKLGDGIGWYNNIGIAGSPGNLTTNDGWSGIDTAWRQAKIGLPAYANFDPLQAVRLKITFGSPSDSTIARSEGIAIDSVWIGNKNKIVLLEHFTNNLSDGTTTAPIASANTSVKTIRDSRPKDVAMLSYHASFPGADPFNITYPDGPSARVLYYGVGSAPRSVLDGNYYNGNIYSGGTSEARLELKDVDARSLETADYQIDMTTVYNPGVATVAAKITYTGINPDSNDLVLHMVIIEDDTTGAIKYPAVVRQMLPDAAGSYISRNWVYGDSETYSYNWNHTLPGTAILGAVVFVQDAASREVYQTAFLRGSGTYGSPVVTGIEDELKSDEFKVRMFPNPATDEVFFIYGKALKESSEWVIYDHMGRIVENGICSQGKEGFSINTSKYAGGLYHVKLHGANGAIDHKELVVIH